MSALRVFLSVLVASVVAALAINVVAPPAATAAQPGMSLQPAPPIKGESFTLSGHLTTRFQRVVKLQRKAGGSWVAVTSANTTSTGSYRFGGRKIWAATTFRALAPTTRHDGRSYPALVSPVRLVTPVVQTGKLRMLPQIAQPGASVAPASSARSALTGEFTPVRVGRKVTLQRQSGSSWVTVTTTTQDSHGVAGFTAPALVNGEVAVYRVFEAAANGAPLLSTPGSRTDTWAVADFSDDFVGTSLGASWGQRGQEYNPEGRRNCSKGSPAAVAVGGGVVRLSVIKDPNRTATTCRAYDASGHYLGNYKWRLNGHISTENQRSFTYGFAAARIRFQPRRGQHGSFWMQPQVSVEAPGNPKLTGAEVDVTEWFGNAHPSGGLSSYAYYPASDGGTTQVGGWIKDPSRFLSSKSDSWSTRFHVFSVEWTPTRYIFRIDGKETYRTSQGVSGQPEFLILSLLSSDYELRYLGGEANLPQTMAVDWVRYWQS